MGSWKIYLLDVPFSRTFWNLDLKYISNFVYFLLTKCSDWWKRVSGFAPNWSISEQKEQIWKWQTNYCAAGRVATGAQQITKPVRMLSKGGTYDLRDWKEQSIKDENTFKSEKRISDNCSQTALCVKTLSHNFSYTPSNYSVSE